MEMKHYNYLFPLAVCLLVEGNPIDARLMIVHPINVKFPAEDPVTNLKHIIR